MKNQNGITLIALVITIIVLLILAGVSIAMLTGDNGILSQATKAGDKTTLEEAREAAKLAIDSHMATYYEEKYVNNNATEATFGAWVDASHAVPADTESPARYTVDGRTITLQAGSKPTGTIADNGKITWSDAATK